jgi:hypothetical protein
MATNLYESKLENSSFMYKSTNVIQVEHNIQNKPAKVTRRPSMSSFYSQLSQVETVTTEDPSWPHNNPNSTPTPVDVAAVLNLLLSQFNFFRQSATDEGHQGFLEDTMELIAEQIDQPPKKVEGVPQSYLDELERVPKKQLKPTDECPICGENFLDDPYPLVVVLPCHPKHRFDLECVAPWLRVQGTCPLDRKDLLKKKEVPKVVDDDEEDFDEMYA